MDHGLQRKFVIPAVWFLFTPEGRLISGGSVERQFSPDVYISRSRARTALRSPSPSLRFALERLS